MEIEAAECLTPAAVLAELRACDQVERAAAAQRLQLAFTWAGLHPGIADQPYDKVVDSLIDEATGVAVAAIAEFAAVHGVSTNAGRQLIGDAVELHDRLPRCWRQMTELRLPAWKARLLAQTTPRLGDVAASWLDVQASMLGDRLGVRTIKRLALMAAARFEPDTLTDPDERRWVRIAADRDGAGGAGWVDGRLDTPDALDLEAALQRIAADLAQAGAQDDLDVRRAQALGVMARRALGQPELPAEAAAESTEPPTDADRSPGSASPGGRPVMLYVHVDAAQLVTGRGLAEVATTGQLVTIDHLRRWCGDAGTITVRPVIDLTTDRTGRGYEPTDTMREHLALRDRTCVFPHCARTAHPIRQRRSRNVSHDADHIVPYVSGGETSTDNLACLCRSHHLLRTHTDWHYTMIGPGEYLWTSPTGHQFLRTNNGTSMLTGLHSRDRPRKAS